MSAQALTECLDRGNVDPACVAPDLFREAALGFTKRSNRRARLCQLGSGQSFARAHDFLGDEVEQAARSWL